MQCFRSKKTGEIAEFAVHKRIEDSEDGNQVYAPFVIDPEEWEKYEEPKEYWAIDCFSPDGELVSQFGKCSERIIENRKQIGNYFETKEEAEKAVEKLKAWKQLKDNCNFRFNGLERDERGRLTGVKVEFDKAQVTFDTAKRCYEILTLLFGGEE